MDLYRVFETPEVQDLYARTDPKVLEELGRNVYPALRTDPTNAAGRLPISYAFGEYGYRIQTANGGRYVLRYQVIPEPPRVLVTDLITVREPS